MSISQRLFIKQEVNNIYTSANKLYYEKEYEKAAILYSKILNDSSDNDIEIIKRTALSYAAINNPEEAVFYLEKYLKQEYNTSIFYNDGFEKIKYTDEFTSLIDKYVPHFNIWTFFYAYFALIGIFMALVINLKKGVDKAANLLIGLYIFFHSVYIIHFVLYLTHYEYLFPQSNSSTATFTLLYGPLLYFYFKRIGENYTFKKRDLLHLLPFILLFIFLFQLVYILPEDLKLWHLLNRSSDVSFLLGIIMFIKVISLTIYGYKIYSIYKKNKGNIAFKTAKSDHFKWQKNIVIFNSIYLSIYVIYAFALVFTKAKAINIDYLIQVQIILISLLILYVGFLGYLKPNVFTLKVPVFGKLTTPKYQNSGMTPSLSKELKHDLIRLFNEEKLYKENNITLDVLSEKIGTSRHNTSQIINEHFNINFFELVNKFRIQEAKNLLELDKYKNLSIINIAYEVGYNNKVTFNKAFKKETGLTPSQYIESLVRKESSRTA